MHIICFFKHFNSVIIIIILVEQVNANEMKIK